MTAPYRTSEDSLRAEVERLARELAAARSPARRWAVPAHATAMLPIPAAAWVMEALAFVGHGWTPSVQRGGLVCAVATIAWALAFVRRVPVDGGGE